MDSNFQLIDLYAIIFSSFSRGYNFETQNPLLERALTYKGYFAERAGLPPRPGRPAPVIPKGGRQLSNRFAGALYQLMSFINIFNEQ